MAVRGLLVLEADVEKDAVPLFVRPYRTQTVGVVGGPFFRFASLVGLPCEIVDVEILLAILLNAVGRVGLA